MSWVMLMGDILLGCSSAWQEYIQCRRTICCTTWYLGRWKYSIQYGGYTIVIYGFQAICNAIIAITIIASQHILIHWGRDKMVAFFRRHFQTHFLEWKIWISIKISLPFVPRGLINNNGALVQVMALRRTGDKPLSEPMVA